jgi:hypothetical protein
VAEWLGSNREALSSNPRIAKKYKNKRVSRGVELLGQGILIPALLSLGLGNSLPFPGS